MIAFVADWLTATWLILCESAPYLFLGFLIAGLIKVLVPDEKILKHLGGNDLRSVVYASAIGAPMPLCSCSVLPTAVQLRTAGASKGATTAFLISTPETGVDQIAITWSLIDPMMAFLRPVAGIITATCAGVIVNGLVKLGWDIRKPSAHEPPAAPDPLNLDACCAPAVDAAPHVHDHGHDHAHDHAPTAAPAAARPRGFVAVVKAAVAYALGPMLDDISRWFILGFVLSGLIWVLIPPNFFIDRFPNGFVSILLMLLISLPLYVCATGSTPVAAALIAKGLNPGAALVLLLAGPATSLSTVFVVRRLLGGRSTFIYILTISFFAVGFGLLADQIYAWMGKDARAIVTPDVQAMGWLAHAFATALLVLLIVSARRTGFLRWFGDSLRTMLSPFSIDPTSRLSKAVAALAVFAAWASTGVSAVGPGEVGFVMRFGKIVETRTEPGRVVHWPFPIGRVETVRTDEIRSVTFGAESTTYGENFDLFGDVEGLNKSNEDELVTGEENLIRIAFSVHYRVRDPRVWRFGLADPERLLRGLSESALRHFIGHTRSDESLVASREVMESAILAILRRELDALHTGIEAVAIQLLEMHAPDAVHYQYRDVATAIEQRTRRTLEGRGYANERLARARGEVVSIETGAKTQAIKVLGKAKGEGAAYARINAAFHSHEALTRLRLELETLARTLKKTTLVVLLGNVTVDLWKGKPGVGAAPVNSAPAPRIPETRPQEDQD